MRPGFRLLLIAAALLGAGPGAPTSLHLDVSRLQRVEPGWTVIEARGDATSGSVTAERVVWPVFYIHWKPLGAGVKSVKVEQAEKEIGSLWEGFAIDGPLEGKPAKVSGHDAILFETTTSHGEMRTRYYVWACPESNRLMIADMSVNLKVTAPPELQDLMGRMARTVKCHPEAAVESFPDLARTREIPGVKISYALPERWEGIEHYRVQRTFLGSDMAASRMPGSTPEQGQDLTLEKDAMRRLFVSWAPAGDFPMSYEVLQKKVEEHWRERAGDMIINERRVVNDVWIIDGIVRPAGTGQDVPPTKFHRYRFWMWTRDGVTYVAVGQIAGIWLGRYNVGWSEAEVNLSLEEMFEAVLY